MKYTPEKIVQEGLMFSIPIYQRLFEWSRDNVYQLLTDLKNAYIDAADKDYYIGMLTTTTIDGKKQLVDGQQRFTVLTLLGCVLQILKDKETEIETEWKNFLLYDEKPRLYFDARKKDNAYLKQLIDKRGDTVGTVNQKMKEAIDEITKFIDNEEQLKDQTQQFSHYLYQHISFFISELPPNYHVQDLNKYFERMNSGGKNLEQHEILKVKMLRNLDGDVVSYMQLWNKIADVDTLFFRCEDTNKLKEQKNRALSITMDTLSSQLPELIHYKSDDDERTIIDVMPSLQKPKQENRVDTISRGTLRFPYLLLQTLYYYLSKKGVEIPRIDEFFNQGNLLETFKTYLPYEGENVNKEELKQFVFLLVRSRIVMDICFIRTSEYGYTLDMECSEYDKDLQELLMFESFLYVSSSNYTNYRWFGWLMDYMEGKQSIPAPKELFRHLIVQCDKANPLPEEENLCFGKDIRYWFWRLDFYLWQQRENLFSSEDGDAEYLKIANNYVFSRNRSIEHIAPQHPKTESRIKWEDDKEDPALRDSFGNLVMISQGLNSALSNSSFEEKRAHVESYFRSVTGSIESLKLLMVYKDYKNGWNKDTIKAHGKKMYGLLEKALKES